MALSVTAADFLPIASCACQCPFFLRIDTRRTFSRPWAYFTRPLRDDESEEQPEEEPEEEEADECGCACLGLLRLGTPVDIVQGRMDGWGKVSNVLPFSYSLLLLQVFTAPL